MHPHQDREPIHYSPAPPPLPPMQYQPHQYPPPQVQVQQPQHNVGLTFMGMSGGILMLVMALVIVLPIVGCFGLCLMGGVIGATTPTPTPSP